MSIEQCAYIPDDVTICVSVAGLYTNHRLTEGSKSIRKIEDYESINKPTQRFISALAGLAVSKASAEIIALAIRPNFQMQKIDLFCAENNIIAEKTKDHLKFLWDSTVHFYNIFSSKMSEADQSAEAEALEQSVLFQAHKFSGEKLHKTLTKYASIFVSQKGLVAPTSRGVQMMVSAAIASGAVDVGANDAVPTTTDANNGIEFILNMYAQVHALLDFRGKMKKNLNDSIWSEVIELLKHAHVASTREFSEEDFEAFEEKFQVQETFKSKFIRSLEKIFRIVNYTRNLKDFARVQVSASEKIVACSLEVITLQGEQTHVAQDWKSASKWVTLAADTLEIDKLKSFNAKIPPEPKLTRHCEVSLILHLHELMKKESSSPPIPFVGVSKLSCLPCWTWIETFNRTIGSDFKFIVSGCHSKCYPMWWMPPFGEHHEFYDSLMEMCKNAININHKQHGRQLSDSTDPSVGNSSE